MGFYQRWKEDVATIREKDPAARSSVEVVLLYSGFKAVRSYRKAHWLYNRNLKFLARWIAQRSVRKTNIEIHPAAQIGRRLFIDHGTGVVIGETTIIGDDCVIYQGVTLGGTGKDKGKRHPTLHNNVMVGAGAKVLGPIMIGDNARIAAGAVVLKDITAGCTAVGVPARIVRCEGEKPKQLDQVDIPDPIAQELARLEERIGLLEQLLGDNSVKVPESSLEKDKNCQCEGNGGAENAQR